MNASPTPLKIKAVLKIENKGSFKNPYPLPPGGY